MVDQRAAPGDAEELQAAGAAILYKNTQKVNFNELQIVFVVFLRELLADCVGFHNANQAQSIAQWGRETHTPWSRFEGGHTHCVL